MNTITNGTIVWAKFRGYPWWPSKVESEENLPSEFLSYKPKTPLKHIPVYVFGKEKHAWANTKYIKPFEKYKEIFITEKRTKLFNRAIIKALRELHPKEYPLVEVKKEIISESDNLYQPSSSQTPKQYNNNFNSISGNSPSSSFSINNQTSNSILSPRSQIGTPSQNSNINSNTPRLTPNQIQTPNQRSIVNPNPLNQISNPIETPRQNSIMSSNSSSQPPSQFQTPVQPNSIQTPSQIQTPRQSSISNSSSGQTPKQFQTPNEDQTPNQLRTPNQDQTPSQLRTPNQDQTPSQLRTPNQDQTPNSSSISKQFQTPKPVQTPLQNTQNDNLSSKQVQTPIQNGVTSSTPDRTPNQSMSNSTPSQTPSSNENLVQQQKTSIHINVVNDDKNHTPRPSIQQSQSSPSVVSQATSQNTQSKSSPYQQSNPVQTSGSTMDIDPSSSSNVNNVNQTPKSNSDSRQEQTPSSKHLHPLSQQHLSKTSPSSVTYESTHLTPNYHQNQSQDSSSPDIEKTSKGKEVHLRPEEVELAERVLKIRIKLQKTLKREFTSSVLKYINTYLGEIEKKSLSLNVLKYSKIGKIIKILAKKPYPTNDQYNIQHRCITLFGRWKNLLKENSSHSNNNMGGVNSPSSPSIHSDGPQQINQAVASTSTPHHSHSNHSPHRSHSSHSHHRSHSNHSPHRSHSNHGSHQSTPSQTVSTPSKALELLSGSPTHEPTESKVSTLPDKNINKNTNTSNFNISRQNNNDGWQQQPPLPPQPSFQNQQPFYPVQNSPYYSPSRFSNNGNMTPNQNYNRRYHQNYNNYNYRSNYNGYNNYNNHNYNRNNNMSPNRNYNPMSPG